MLLWPQVRKHFAFCVIYSFFRTHTWAVIFSSNVLWYSLHPPVLFVRCQIACGILRALCFNKGHNFNMGLSDHPPHSCHCRSWVLKSCLKSVSYFFFWKALRGSRFVAKSDLSPPVIRPISLRAPEKALTTFSRLRFSSFKNGFISDGIEQSP